MNEPARYENPSDAYDARRKVILKSARKLDNVDAVLLSRESDIRYAAGLIEGSRFLFIGRRWASLFTTRMYKDRAPLECPGCCIHVPRKNFFKVMRKRLLKRNVRRLGFQRNVLTLAQFDQLKQELKGIKLIPLNEFVAGPRSIKDTDELRRTAQAVRIAEGAFRDLTKQGAAGLIGRTERSIALELETRMIERGARRQSFPNGIIVAAGANSAACHHRPTRRKIRDGNVVLIDWGAEVEGGYRSDQTRVLFMRNVPPRIEKIYPIVLEGYQRAVKMIRSGRKAKKIDCAARAYIAGEGYGEEFRHGLGHGVGLDLHEYPILADREEERLVEHQIVTVEPGIYFIGYGGVRLENMVQVTEDGCRVLNRLPLSLDRAVLT